MNLTTKTGVSPQGLREIVVAENSANVEIYYRYASGRQAAYSERERRHLFPVVGVDMGRFVDINHFALEGYSIWGIIEWKKFWAGVSTGQLGLNPRPLFAS